MSEMFWHVVTSDRTTWPTLGEFVIYDAHDGGHRTARWVTKTLLAEIRRRVPKQAPIRWASWPSFTARMERP